MDNPPNLSAIFSMLDVRDYIIREAFGRILHRVSVCH